MTLEQLKNFGADTEEGMARCMDNEEFYFKMIGLALSEESLETLGKQLSEKKLDDAFETAHALKGVYGNLSLTPLLSPVSEMTELLRAKTDTDYSEFFNKAVSKRDELKALYEA